MKNKIIDYITRKYDPYTLILYGSYADGSNNANSDFDALRKLDSNSLEVWLNHLKDILLKDI